MFLVSFAYASVDWSEQALASAVATSSYLPPAERTGEVAENIKLRDMGSINVSLESITESQLSSNSSINSNLSKDSVLFWFITTLNNKIPYWLKFLFSFLINLRS